MTYKEAQKYSLTVKWKIVVCNQGKMCWCRHIRPVVPIVDDQGEEVIILHPGSLSKAAAKHIVKLHNNSISKKYKHEMGIQE